MTLTFYIVWSKPEGFTWADVARRKVKIVDWAGSPAEVFEDELGGGQMRSIGAIGFDPKRTIFSAHPRVGTTRDDILALCALALSHRNCESRTTGRQWKQNSKGMRYALVARPLTDYGDDLALVVGIPDTVPVDLASTMTATN